MGLEIKTLADFQVDSSFSVAYNGSSYYTTNHNTGSVTKTFDFSTIPTGSTIDLAIIGSTTTLSNYGIRLVELNVNNTGNVGFYDMSGSSRVMTVTSIIQGLMNVGTKTVSVVYRFGGTTNSPSSYSTGVKYSHLTFASNTLFISYTEPYATKVWNGSSWVSGTPHVWNGSAWVRGTAYVWNGTEWKPGLI